MPNTTVPAAATGLPPSAPPKDLGAIQDRLSIARNMIACAWLANQGDDRGELHHPVTETISRAMGDLDDCLETLGEMVRRARV